MKRYLLLLAVLLNAVWASAQFSGSGEGTENSPYLIYNENQLAQVANFLNQEGVVFKLQKDLDVSYYISENNPTQGWTPIGVESAPFKGVFIGNGHKIHGLFINRPTQNNVGFFGYIDNASISGLTIEDASVVGKQDVGILCGYSLGGCKIASCTITGESKSTESTLEWGAVGAMCGTALNVTISDCKVEANITGAKIATGGLVGRAMAVSSFTNCYSSGKITGNGNVGGCVGMISTSQISFINTHFKGNVINSGDNTGGILGLADGGGIDVMENCSHFGDIEGKDYVGGLIGNINSESIDFYIGTATENTKNQGSRGGGTYSNDYSNPRKINNCTSIGNISGNNYVGGCIGRDYGYAFLFYSETGGSGLWYYNDWQNWWVSFDKGKTSTYVGHYLGYAPKRKQTVFDLTNNYFSGNVSGTQNVGGIVGHIGAGSIKNCYTYATVTGNVNIGGIAGEILGRRDHGLSNNMLLKSNVAINSLVSANTSNVGRIYGSIGENVTIGALASQEGNRALTQTSVMLNGVAQDVIDDEQNGTSVGPSMLKLKANYVSWGWSFDENWNILETECYPYKKYQAAPPVIESSLVSHATEIKGKSLNGGTVYMYYKDRDAVSTRCNGNQWSFTTEELQSGAQVQLYADVDGMTPSYFTSATVKYPGSGTEADPYRIYSAEDLQGASNSGYYKVMNDIDLTNWIKENSPTTGWPAVGRNSTAATYIDGDGHTVTGLWINTTDDYNGLFSNYSAGYIKNLNVEVASGKKVKGGDYTGVLIGRMYNGQIVNCKINGNVQGTVHTGGIVGYTEKTTLKNNKYAGTATSSASNGFVGGIAGHAKIVTVTNNSADATVKSTGATSNVGGLFGYVEDGVVAKSFANATVTASGIESNVGGMVGKSAATINTSYSTGSVTASGNDSNTGGLVGMSSGAINDCYSTSTATGTQYTAGLVGYSYGTIDKCYAKGDVNGVMYGAGVVGELDGASAALTNSVAANNIISLTAQSSWGCRVVGGFKNGCEEPDNSNYALNTMQVSLNNVPQRKTDDNIEGIAKPASELMTADFYDELGWDMFNTWSINEGSGYPYMAFAEEVVNATGIALNNSTLTIKPGETATLLATIMPDDATKKSVAWSSSNTYVATVENGKVTALTTGTTIITATTTDGTNLSAECKVTVTAKDVAPQEEDTDISQYTDIVYFDKVIAKPGASIVLPLQLNNEMEVAAARFDIEFPDGVTLNKNSRGKYDIRFNAEANRSDASLHSVSSALQADGSIRVICYSATADVFAGNEGAIFDFPVTVSSDLEAGDYKIVIKNIELTKPNGVSKKLDKVVSTITIPSYTRGDANGDDEIGMSDVMYIVNYLLGSPAEDFDMQGADANEDGELGMSDVMYIVQYLLAGSFPDDEASQAKKMQRFVERFVNE